MPINRVLLVGNLGKDPELRHTQGGLAVVDFSIAVNSYRGSGTDRTERVDWFDIQAWKELAENVCEFVSKGDPVAIDGRLRREQWEKDGEKRSRIVVVADNVQFLRRGEGGGGQTPLPADEDAPY